MHKVAAMGVCQASVVFTCRCRYRCRQVGVANADAFCKDFGANGLRTSSTAAEAVARFGKIVPGVFQATTASAAMCAGATCKAGVDGPVCCRREPSWQRVGDKPKSPSKFDRVTDISYPTKGSGGRIICATATTCPASTNGIFGPSNQLYTYVNRYTYYQYSGVLYPVMATLGDGTPIVAYADWTRESKHTDKTSCTNAGFRWYKYTSYGNVEVMHTLM